MSTSSLIALATSTTNSLGSQLFGILPTVFSVWIGWAIFFAIVGWLLFRFFRG